VLVEEDIKKGIKSKREEETKEASRGAKNAKAKTVKKAFLKKPTPTVKNGSNDERRVPLYKESLPRGGPEAQTSGNTPTKTKIIATEVNGAISESKLREKYCQQVIHRGSRR